MKKLISIRPAPAVLVLHENDSAGPTESVVDDPKWVEANRRNVADGLVPRQNDAADVVDFTPPSDEESDQPSTFRQTSFMVPVTVEQDHADQPPSYDDATSETRDNENGGTEAQPLEFDVLDDNNEIDLYNLNSKDVAGAAVKFVLNTCIECLLQYSISQNIDPVILISCLWTIDTLVVQFGVYKAVQQGLIKPENAKTAVKMARVAGIGIFVIGIVVSAIWHASDTGSNNSGSRFSQGSTAAMFGDSTTSSMNPDDNNGDSSSTMESSKTPLFSSSSSSLSSRSSSTSSSSTPDPFRWIWDEHVQGLWGNNCDNLPSLFTQSSNGTAIIKAVRSSDGTCDSTGIESPPFVLSPNQSACTILSDGHFGHLGFETEFKVQTGGDHMIVIGNHGNYIDSYVETWGAGSYERYNETFPNTIEICVTARGDNEEADRYVVTTDPDINGFDFPVLPGHEARMSVHIGGTNDAGHSGIAKNTVSKIKID